MTIKDMIAESKQLMESSKRRPVSSTQKVESTNKVTAIEDTKTAKEVKNLVSWFILMLLMAIAGGGLIGAFFVLFFICYRN